MEKLRSIAEQNGAKGRSPYNLLAKSRNGIRQHVRPQAGRAMGWRNGAEARLQNSHGIYPAWMYQPGDLEQAIHAVTVLREELLNRTEDDDPRVEEGKECNRNQ